MDNHSSERWQSEHGPCVGDDLLAEIQRCRPWLEAAMDRSGFGMQFDDLTESLWTDPTFALWASEHAVIVTEEAGYRLNLLLAGGALDELEALMAQIEPWAASRGLSQILLFARRGWERTFLHSWGYAPRWTVMEKTLWAE